MYDGEENHEYKRSGLAAKTIRYYESIDLLKPALRAANGYRRYQYEEVDAHMRELGETRDLLAKRVGACANDEDADCTIIDTLAGQREQAASQNLTEVER